MPSYKYSKRGLLKRGMIVVGLLTAALLAGACTPPEEVDAGITLLPSQAPTDVMVDATLTPEPENVLFVCLNQEPQSLYLYSDAYLYGEARLETNAILQAIYDGPYDILNYQPQPVILASIPSVESGDVRYNTVDVAEGEVYLNPISFQPENLERGKPYLPADCTDASCIREFEGGSVAMLQMEVDFQLLPDLFWSDGEPLTADDSVYSYQLDSDADTPTTKYLVVRTESYTAVDDGMVRWTGVPGFLDAEYATIFWSPLPRHQLGRFDAADVLSAEEANRMPLSWGAYQIEGWSEEGLALTPNPHYFRAAEGLPVYDRLVFRYLDGGEAAAIQQVMTGECDVIDESLLSLEALPTLQEFAQEERLVIRSTPGGEIERIDFNLLRQNGDSDGLSFSDVRLRQAIAGCMDREAYMNTAVSGYGLVSDSYLSPLHPLYRAGDGSLDYDPAFSMELLDQLGWVDEDDDPATPRIARGVLDNAFGTPLVFNLTYVPEGFRRQLAEQVQSDLAVCGIGVNLVEVEQSELVAPWPDGVAFNGGFDAVLWAWPDWVVPFCEMYADWEIPSAALPFGSNASGYENSAYNGACRTALLGLPATMTMQVIQERYQEDLPSIPLFTRPRYLVHVPGLTGIEPDSLVFSLLWSLEEMAPVE